MVVTPFALVMLARLSSAIPYSSLHAKHSTYGDEER